MEEKRKRNKSSEDNLKKFAPSKQRIKKQSDQTNELTVKKPLTHTLSNQ